MQGLVIKSSPKNFCYNGTYEQIHLWTTTKHNSTTQNIGQHTAFLFESTDKGMIFRMSCIADFSRSLRFFSITLWYTRFVVSCLQIKSQRLKTYVMSELCQLSKLHVITNLKVNTKKIGYIQTHMLRIQLIGFACLN